MVVCKCKNCEALFIAEPLAIKIERARSGLRSIPLEKPREENVYKRGFSKIGAPLAKTIEKNGIKFTQYVCPKCNEENLYPYPYEKSSEQRWVLGFQREKDFKIFWDRFHKSEFGVLIRTDVNPYDSKPDYLNRTLLTHFESKDKGKSWDWILHEGRALAWINQKSMDHKARQQKENPNELYVVTMFFPDEGWYVVPVKKVVKYEPQKPYYVTRGTGSPFYPVPLDDFVSFLKFIEGRTKEVL